ncbi:MAG TPA: peptidoglycan DD-metalloendopeptidase family protein [Acidimicrobiales bacterium]|nr:peptidoglycan DD-metalloendopeptidase family protein [Acidimicrobiales bacterium]
MVRGAFAALVAAALLSTALPADASQADLDRARARANRAAAELDAAQTRLAELEQEQASLSAQLDATNAELTAVQAAVRDRAVERYMRGGAVDGVTVGGDDDLTAELRASTLARYVSLGSEDAIDEYRRVTEDITVLRGSLAAASEEAERVASELDGRVDAAFAELRRLEKLETERRAREAAQRAAAGRRASGSSGGGGSGGRRTTSFTATGDWMCPVQGARAFTNDWGNPRSGGRRHQGTDILSPRGTPVVASVSGTVRGHNSRLGGISYYLNGDDGNTYFGTHLDSLSGASGRVSQGAVLGYVGNTGNARGGPTHLHFEIHPGGGRPVNPYPTLRQYC